MEMDGHYTEQHKGYEWKIYLTLFACTWILTFRIVRFDLKNLRLKSEFKKKERNQKQI